MFEEVQDSDMPIDEVEEQEMVGEVQDTHQANQNQFTNGNIQNTEEVKINSNGNVNQASAQVDQLLAQNGGKKRFVADDERNLDNDQEE